MEYVIYNNRQHKVKNFQLDLSNIGLSKISLIQNLDKLKTVRTLFLQNNVLENIDGLEQLSSLKILYIYNNRISEIDGLGTLENLEDLKLSNNEIKVISGLNNLQRLKKLDLSSNKIEDISGLETLTSLEELNLSKNRITKISGLKALLHLKDLTLNDNKITKIENLDALSNLQYLNLSANPINSITGLENLKNVKHIRISDTLIPIELFEKLGGLKYEMSSYKAKEPQNLVRYCQGSYVDYHEKFYYLNNNKLKLNNLDIENISDIKHLEKLNFLEDLELMGNKINEINNLDTLIHLKRLNLTSNQIQNIENLTPLKELELLSLSGNKIKAINSLDKLRKLKHLNLSNNEISEITGLQNLTSLKELTLSGNQIKSITNLHMLINLEELNLSNNLINEIQGFDHLKKLKRLYLGNNNITSIDGIEKLYILEKLNLNGNSVQNIDNLNNCINLTELYLANNLITEIRALENLVNLKFINFENNKIDENIFNLLNFTNNDPKLFISYCILKPIIENINDIIDWSKVITKFPYLRDLDYKQLRDISNTFKCVEIQISNGFTIENIVTPEYLAVDFDKLIEPIPVHDDLKFSFIKQKLRLINEEAARKLSLYLKNNELSRFTLYEIEDGIRKLGKPEITIEESSHSSKLIKLLPDGISEKKYRDILDDLKLPNTMFQFIFACENIVRKFIIQILDDKGYPSINSIRNGQLTKIIQDRKNQEANQKYLPIRGDHDIYYLDLIELNRVIRHLWKECFENKFEDQHWIFARISSLYSIRNRVAHSSSLTSDELKSVETYCREIIKQIDQYIK